MQRPDLDLQADAVQGKIARLDHHRPFGPSPGCGATGRHRRQTRGAQESPACSEWPSRPRHCSRFPPDCWGRTHNRPSPHFLAEVVPATALRTIEFFKSILDRFAEEISSFGTTPTMYAGMVDDGGGLQWYDGLLQFKD